MKKKILITGCAGYIGSELARLLLNNNYHVIGLDTLKFGKRSIVELLENPDFTFLQTDIRNGNCISNVVDNIYGVVHLAAIVGDPACAKSPHEAFGVNWIASKELFNICANSNSVKRFIFASTCSNYGKMNGEEYLNEDSELRPVSLYARLKVMFEKYLLESDTRKDFIPTALRFSTVYGISPRLRFDLTVNEFIRDAALKKRLVIYGENFWRPYCHVNDITRACKLVLESPPEKVDHNVFGIGDTNENYQKKTIADEILKILPDTKVTYISKEEDPRDYRVDFSKIKRELNFNITKKLPNGLQEIHELLCTRRIENPFSKIYTNI